MCPSDLSKADKETLISCSEELGMANCACHLHYISAACRAYNHLKGPSQAFISCTPKAPGIIGLYDLEIGHWAVKYQPLGKALNSEWRFDTS